MEPTRFTPAFGGYAERVRRSFARQGAMAYIGAAAEASRERRVGERMQQTLRVMHGRTDA